MGKTDAPKLPSWDDAVAGTPLNLASLLDTIRKVLGGLPPDANHAAIDEVVTARLNSAFSPENIAAVKANLVPLLVKFAATGKGPVQKSASDLVG